MILSQDDEALRLMIDCAFIAEKTYSVFLEEFVNWYNSDDTAKLFGYFYNLRLIKSILLAREQLPWEKER